MLGSHVQRCMHSNVAEATGMELQTGDISLMEYLLQNGAKWDRTDPYGRTPLHCFILHEHPQAAKQLLKR